MQDIEPHQYQFSDLIHRIAETHVVLQRQAISAINKSITMRNWLIGYYIVDFEQQGANKANYGSNLLELLAAKLLTQKLSNTSAPELRRYRKFYLSYPGFFHVFLEESIRGTLSHDLTDALIRGTVSHELKTEEVLYFSTLWKKISFSHLVELIKIDDTTKRKFYEIQTIQGTWSVRELKRQIGSLYFERTGLSTNPEKLQEITNQNSNTDLAVDFIKNPMVFEFLGISSVETVLEKDLENALLTNLQQFLMELGHGFCFEARQKRILIDDEYFYIDLVFYHRILKCHVLIELKAESFNHENAGQLDTYLQYYKHEVMQSGDNEPIGILLCTDAKKTMVKYATANKSQLLVNQYMVNLPSDKQLEEFIDNQINKDLIHSENNFLQDDNN